MSAAFLPIRTRGQIFELAQSSGSSTNSSEHGEFHLHPRYKTQRPLDALLLKTDAVFDDFVTEKYQDQIAAILAEWTAGLLQSPQDMTPIKKVLSMDFLGTSFAPVESRLMRSDAALEIREQKFATRSELAGDDFIRDLQSSMSSLSRIVTAEFQIAAIEGVPTESVTSQLTTRVKTGVRYDLIGSSKDFFREQRVGHWDLEWETASSGGSGHAFRLRRWQQLNETRSRAKQPIFIDIAEQAMAANSSFSSQLLRGSDYWRTVLDGACGIDIYGHNGVSVADIDGDGFDDLYVCQPAGLPNRLYRNRGDATFEDITETSGLGILDNTACALFADFDNDGRQDVIVVRANGPLLFLNQGGGKFREKPKTFQFANQPQGTFTGAAVADYDRDGWLDIYLCLYSYYQGADQYNYPSPYYDAENGPPNFMMHNQRDGTFRDVTAETGLNQNNTRYSFYCAWNDYNGDGWPDLYVVNDFGRKNLYRNNGNGTFTDVAPEVGVEDVGAGMSVCWLDYDNDGADDLYVANMWTAAGKRLTTQNEFQKDAPARMRELYRKHAMGNSLFRDLKVENGKSKFEDTTASAGVAMGRWSWSSDAWDFDHDGFPDLYIANGMVSGPMREDLNSFFWRQVVAKSPNEAKPCHDYEQGWNAINELIRADHSWSGYERNVVYANNRDGTFSDVSGAVGLDFMEDGRSFALADFDHDGRQEVFLKNRNAPQLRVLKNAITELPPSISFRLRGTKSNRDAIGAVITIQTEVAKQTRSLQAGSGFLSQHSKDVFFGLGQAKGTARATVRWPSGLVQELRDLPMNHRILVEEGVNPSRMEPFKSTSLPSKDGAQLAGAQLQAPESLPGTVETWLLVPVAAPDFSLSQFGGRVRSLREFFGTTVLLSFWSTEFPEWKQELAVFERHHKSWAAQGLQFLSVNVDQAENQDSLRRILQDDRFSFLILRGSDEIAGIYNILYRCLFDRHRDLVLPTSLLIDPAGNIVRVYQGPLNRQHVEDDFRLIPQTSTDRLAKALPFPGVADSSDFQRNYLSLGSVFFQRGYYDQAGTYFQQAVRDEPSSAEALYGVGSVCLEQGKNDAAREYFERAVKLSASYPETLPNAWNNLGILETRDGRAADAILYFDKALELSPDHLVALENLGNAYRQLQQWDQARTVLEHAVKIGPQDPEANYSLGMVYAQLQDNDRAYAYLQAALKLRPNYPEALNNLGVLYLRTQRRDQAVASFEECIRLAPAFDQSYLNLARVYVVENAPEKARDVLRLLLKHHPDHVQAKAMLEQLGR